MASKKPASIATSKAKSQHKSTAKATGYKGHVPGSRKGTIHELFDKDGTEVAWTRGIKVGLKESTLRSWFGFWRRESTSKPKTT